MTKLKTGIIYKIVHTQSDLCYVGMTMNTLAKRFQNHKDNCKKPESKNKTCIYPYMLEYGIENFRIMPIKTYQVVDKQHLKVFETLWINKLNCVNKLTSFNPLSRTRYQKLYRAKKALKLG